MEKKLPVQELLNPSLRENLNTLASRSMYIGTGSLGLLGVALWYNQKLKPFCYIQRKYLRIGAIIMTF